MCDFIRNWRNHRSQSKTAYVPLKFALGEAFQFDWSEDKVSKGNGRVVNTRFFAMTAHYLFDPDFCNVASGWEKGVVEKNVQDMRRRLWNEAKQQRFSSFEDLNNWLEARCRALWSEI